MDRSTEQFAGWMRYVSTHSTTKGISNNSSSDIKTVEQRKRREERERRDVKELILASMQVFLCY